MKISIIYGNDAVVLPGAAAGKIDKATKRDLKILFLLAASPEKRADTDKYCSEMATEAGCTESELLSSIAFWRGAGIIDSGECDELIQETVRPVATKEKTAEKKPELPDELPSYTTVELNAILEKNREAKLLIDECSKVYGKMFNPHEVGVILALQEYLGLESEYILILFDHCVRMGKKSLQYIKKRAFTLYDEGITEPVGLQEKLRKIEASATLEGEIRKLFGMKDRELTTKEKKYITAWVGEYGYGIDIITKAYEMTVDAIHEPAPAYANAIIERWNRDGLRTLVEIEAAQAEKLPLDGSFDTTDFFESALKRSFNDNNDS